MSKVTNYMDLHDFCVFSYDSVILSAVFLLLDHHIGDGDPVFRIHLAENGEGRVVIRRAPGNASAGRVNETAENENLRNSYGKF